MAKTGRRWILTGLGQRLFVSQLNEITKASWTCWNKKASSGMCNATLLLVLRNQLNAMIHGKMEARNVWSSEARKADVGGCLCVFVCCFLGLFLKRSF